MKGVMRIQWGKRKTGRSDGKGQSLWKLSRPTAPITTTIIHSRIRLLVILSYYIHNNTVFLPVSADLITHKNTHCIHNKTFNKDLKGCIVLPLTLPFCFVNKAVMCPLSLSLQLSLCSRQQRRPAYLLNHGGDFSLFDAVVSHLSWIYTLASRCYWGHKRRLCSSAKGTAGVDMQLCLHIRATETPCF